ncbi:hypothetical protein C8F04DRAFT_630777 [Mycena alexandri]|uniref:YCII-related domain-containing protein n=1 Tax=Mycena alexandri TaxID=1745969 RepID=A0AAD6SS89_9AGAR|nr:hypothetical protein C8F04DRAFT_630777 [Mycena alexandri]
MSTPNLHKFLVYAPDKTDEGAFERRLSVRAKHLENAAKVHEAHMRLGGAMLTPESLTGADKKMVRLNSALPRHCSILKIFFLDKVGSLIIYEAENIETVRGWIESDIYYTAGVWDPAQLVIAPFVAATPFP